MRRKLFCTLMAVMTILFFADFIGIPLKDNTMDGLIGQSGRITGKVAEVQYKDAEKYNLEIDIYTFNSRSVRCREKLLLTIYSDLEEPWNYYNELISFEGEITEPSGQRNPHCFDYKKYLKSRGIGAVSSADTFTVQQSGLTLKEKYEKWLFRQRCMFEKELTAETRGVIMGVLFGDTTFLDEDFMWAFFIHFTRKHQGGETAGAG